MLGDAFEIVGVLFFSWLSDYFGRRPKYMFGALFSAAFAFPFFMLTNTLNPVLISVAFILITGIGGGAMFGPQAAYFAELFGPRLRFSGFAFARELGSILAGGPSPLIAAFSVWCGLETNLSDIVDDDRWDGNVNPAISGNAAH